MTIPTQVCLDVPIAMPDVAPIALPPVQPMTAEVMPLVDQPLQPRDFKIACDMIDLLRVELRLQRSAYFDELMKRLKAGIT